MSVYGGVASFLQESGGFGQRDPYGSYGASGVVSSWSDLALNLANSLGNVGVQALAADVSGSQLVATGNSANPLTTIPSVAQSQALIAARNAQSNPMTGVLLLGAVAIGAILLFRR